MSDADPPPSPDPDQPDRRWSSLHLWQIQGVRDVMIFFGVLALFWLGQKVSVVTVPVLLAILLAYLFEPVINWLSQRTRLNRTGAVIAIIATTIALVIVPAVLVLTYGVVEGVGFAGRTTTNIGRVLEYVDTPEPTGRPGHPEYQAANTLLSFNRVTLEECGSSWLWIGDSIRDSENSQLADALNRIYSWSTNNSDRIAQTAASAGIGVVQSALAFLASAFALMFMAFLTIFFFFFFATGWVHFKGFTNQLLPDKNRDLIIDLATKFDRVISAFIRGRLTIAFIQAIVFTIGFWLIGVPAAFILGPAVALLSIVPYLALIGVPVAIVLLWLEAHTGIRGSVIWVIAAPLGFYFFAQALDDYVWTPLIQGKSTDMSTPMILFASIAGGVLFGVFGLLIAIPIAACLKILIQEVFWPRFNDWAEGRARDVLPID